MPLPTLNYLIDGRSTEIQRRTASVFIALVSLTEVLDLHLQQIYNVRGDKSWNTASLELSVNNWVDSLSDCTRLIILRGTHLDVPGAANLRLAYLTMRLLLQRIQLEADKHIYELPDDRLRNRYVQARRTAEEILILTQEFQAEQLGDFWLSISAFSFPATVNFLLRCGLETENSPQGLAESGSFRIARDLIATLRSHQEKYGWDLGDICLAQHAEVIDKILAGLTSEEQGGDNNMTPEFVMPDISIIDQFLPSLWDPLQTAW